MKWSHLQAVAVLEMRSAARGKSLFAARTGVAVIAAAFVWRTISFFGPDADFALAVPPSYVGSEIFAAGCSFLSSLVFFGGIFLGADCILRERNRQTLLLLLSSRLSPAEIIVGKTSALLALLGMLALSLMPILALVAWLGGVDLRSSAELLLLIFLTALSGVAHGQFAAALKKTRQGIALVASLLIIGTIYFDLAAGTTWFTATFELGEYIAAQQLYEGGVFPLRILQSLMFSSALIVFAIFFLPRRIGSGSADQHAVRDPKKQKTSFLTGKAPAYRPIRKFPVGWLTERTTEPRFGPRAAAFLYIGFFLGAFLFGVLMISSQGFASFFGLSFFNRPIVLLVCLVVGAWLIADERERRTFPVLLATPLTARDILFGKLAANAGLFFLLWILPLAAALPSFLSGDLETWSYSLGMSIDLCSAGLFAYSLGMFCAIFFHGRAQAVFVGGIAIAALKVAQFYLFNLLFSMPFSETFYQMYFSIPVPRTFLDLFLTALLLYFSVRFLDRRLGRSH